MIGRMRRDDASLPGPERERALEALLSGLCDGLLSEAEEARLAEILASDAGARGRYREWLELHAALHWDYAGAAARWDDPRVAAAPPVGPGADGRLARPPWVRLAAGALAAVGLLLGIGWLVIASGGAGRPVVEVASLGGAASWSHEGRVVTTLSVGDRLPVGTFCLEGEAAFMRLLFLDGSEATLSGPSMLEFSDLGQKRLVLRHGSISVDARPQPPGKPMQILTPTAEVEVVGTVFSVSADATETHIGVEEGTVKLRRRADGRSVEVPEHHIATASLEASSPIDVRKPTPVSDACALRFDTPAGRKCEGEWLAAEGGGDDADRVPGRVRAVPRVAGHRPDGSPIVHYGIAYRDQESGFVTFHADSVVAVRFRLEVPQTFRVMLTMRRPGGGFAGNCQVIVPFDAGAERIGPDGWREVQIPASDFRAITDFRPLNPEPYCIGLLLVDAFTSDANLEVSALSVRRSQP